MFTYARALTVTEMHVRLARETRKYVDATDHMH